MFEQGMPLHIIILAISWRAVGRPKYRFLKHHSSASGTSPELTRLILSLDFENLTSWYLVEIVNVNRALRDQQGLLSLDAASQQR